MPPRKRIKGGTNAIWSPLCSGSSNDEVGSRKSKLNLNNGRKRISFLQMPTEIFNEIAGYLASEELLNLACSSQDLRDLLMAKSSNGMWEAARARQVTVTPALPEDLSEPQYADLLFGKGCSFCSEMRTRKPIIELRVRACRACFTKQILSIEELLQSQCTSLPAGIRISTMVPYIYSTGSKYSKKSSIHFVASQFNEVFAKIQALSSSPPELQAYVAMRQNSKNPLDIWFWKVSAKKYKSKAELVQERRASIEKRLRALGYSDEDFDTRYDDKTWNSKWRRLVNQTGTLSETAWRIIKPQLEGIIEIRRVHAAADFLVDRRKKRIEEMRSRFTDPRPQLSEITREKLFTFKDLLELPILKELVEENHCRVPLTDERWRRVTNVLVEAAFSDLGRAIEQFCVKEIKAARGEAMDNDGSDANSKDDDEDCIPNCLLHATSFFRRNKSYWLMSYAGILRERAIFYGYSNFDHRLSWRDEKLKLDTSGNIIVIARALLNHLQLPSETTMSYMVECGRVFRCLRCAHGPGSKKMRWLNLVCHFFEEIDKHEDLRRRNEKCKLNVPIRNDHDLDKLDQVLISRPSIMDAGVSPTSETGDRYSILSTSWGEATDLDYGIDEFDEEEAEVSSDERILNSSSKFQGSCKLCKKLGINHVERSLERLGTHLRTKHGTDLEGKPLPEKSAT